MGEDFLRELKERHIWLIWVWEFKEDGKKTKVPRSADNCGATGTDNKWSHSWVTYNEAIAAKEKFDAAGVGFVIPKGYFFLDIDHYALTDLFVQILLERFSSYAEHSVSGGGIHIYGKCDFEKLPTFKDKNGNRRLDKAYYMKNPKNHLELNIGGLTNRFAVFTSDVVLDESLKESTAAVLLTLERNMRKADKVKYSEKRNGDREIFDIVCNLRKQKNGDKFRKLYDDGDLTGYGSQSEADAALCALIAFRTGPDPAAIDENLPQFRSLS